MASGWGLLTREAKPVVGGLEYSPALPLGGERGLEAEPNHAANDVFSLCEEPLVETLGSEASWPLPTGELMPRAGKAMHLGPERRGHRRCVYPSLHPCLGLCVSSFGYSCSVTFMTE